MDGWHQNEQRTGQYLAYRLNTEAVGHHCWELQVYLLGI